MNRSKQKEKKAQQLLSLVGWKKKKVGFPSPAEGGVGGGGRGEGREKEAGLFKADCEIELVIEQNSIISVGGRCVSNEC